MKKQTYRLPYIKVIDSKMEELMNTSSLPVDETKSPVHPEDADAKAVPQMNGGVWDD